MIFKDFIATAFDGGEYATDDVIAFVLPLFREVLAMHEEGRVAPFEFPDALTVREGVPDIDEERSREPRSAKDRLESLFAPERSKSFDVVGQARLHVDLEAGYNQWADAQVQVDPQAPVTRPVYLPGYTCFEWKLGHHDDGSDIFVLGLILGSMAMGLDLHEEEDLKQFVAQRAHPALYHERIHPTLAALITEMTELDRHRRAPDLYEVISKLEHYRDFDPEKQVDLSTVAGWKKQEVSTRGQFILGKLRNRLFDSSRRNRLLYYKPNARFVNLTVSSVPNVLHYQSIRPELLFTWNEEISARVRDRKDILLNKYLRFEDHPYLPSSLDKIRSEARRDQQEYGFSQLKMVIAFLHWHNLREDRNERIQSPLLLIPVELKKNKKLKEDHYVVSILANEAEVNPILANTLRELYGIRLPDFIDLDDTTVEAFYQNLKAQIDSANQGIQLNYIGKPRIRLIHSVAKQTLTAYRKRVRRTGGVSSWHNIPYSYSREHFQPLGLEVFRQRIRPSASGLEYLINDEIQPSSQHLTGDTRERELFQLADSEANPYSWDLDICNLVLGNFNYRKMSLVRDYNQVIDGGIHHEVFEHLFSDQPRKPASEVASSEDPSGWYHVITADPTQTRAVLRARGGESYIIQGPPGTGKSQTITNLIADFVAEGKRVLFVCEKRAALDVVFHRLKQQGLDELCCYIHDSQGDKREFIKDLKATYESFLRNRPDSRKIASDRKLLLDRMLHHLEGLTDYHQTTAGIAEHAGIPLRQLLERLITIRPHLQPLPPADEEALPLYHEWRSFGTAVEELAAALEDSGAEPYFAGHPLSAVREEVFMAERPIEKIRQATEAARPALEQLRLLMSEYGLTGKELQTFAGMRALTEDAVLLQPLAETGSLPLAAPDTALAQAFEKDYRGYRNLQEEEAQARQANRHWRTMVPETELEGAIGLAREQEQAFFSFFNSSWRKLKKLLNEYYDFGAHAVRPRYSEVLERLRQYYEARRRSAEALRRLQEQYGLADIDAAYAGVQRIRSKSSEPEVQFLLQHPQSAALVRRLHAFSSALWSLEAGLKGLLYDHEAKTLEELLDELDSLEANLDLLPELLPALRSVAQASTSIRRALRRLSLPPLSIEAAMAGKTLKQVYRSKKDFERWDGTAIEAAADQVAGAYEELLRINAQYIRAQLRDRFLEHYELSNRALSGLKPEERELKKQYAEGRKILENEFSKSMRYKSIRELAARESGLVLRDLKPVWLMSPLSVSDSLPVDAQYFDVVIFDEASQITLEEGIPSLYRANQSIIVGDDRQMPPTNFFSAKAEDPDDLVSWEADEDDELLSNEADSLLVQGARKLNSVMLGWHYRSRYETLISYSNHAFYEANLLTIPDRTVHHGKKAAIEVRNAEEAGAHADCLYDRSISFHFLPNSTYEKRANLDEAAYIANLVRELLKRGVEESIGVVAFSQEQQATIEDALEQLATTDKEFESLLEAAYNRTENDQYIGLIIKNLENIQGDERDIIIMSVCYGPDPRRKVLMNFGPVNKKGGEKRLNVLFSRAKKHMAVVSSMKQVDITNDYNEGAAYFKRFLHYAEAVSTGNMALARMILDGLKPKKGEAAGVQSATIVQEQLRKRLEERGYAVSEQVGQSDFRCDLALKRSPEDETYTLGIIIDDEEHYRNANILEQYVQRPGIMDAFGWRTIMVFTRDWLEHPERVMERIEKRLRAAKSGAKSENEEKDGRLKGEETLPVLDFPGKQEFVGEATGAAKLFLTEEKGLDYQRLVCTEGGSNKFWESAVEGPKLYVRFGRVGTKGQTQVKSFASEEEAEKERARLVAEKKGKGYREWAN